MSKYNIYTALSSLLFGLVGYLSIRIINSSEINAINLMFWRFLFATIAYILFFIFLIRAPLFKKNSNVSTKYICLSNALFYVPSCVLCFYASINLGVGLGIISFFSFPVFVALIMWYIEKTPPNNIVIISIALVMFGIILIAPQFNHANVKNIGLLYGLSAAFTFACYIVSLQKVNYYKDEHYVSFISCLTCAATCFIIIIAKDNLAIPKIGSTWIYLILLATAATAIPTYLLLNSIGKINANRIAILSSLEPVFAILLGTTLLHETILKSQYIGIFFIVSGSIFIQFEKNKQHIQNEKT